LRWWWSSFPSIRPVIHPVIHPSKFLIPDEEDEGGGGKTPLVTYIFTAPTSTTTINTLENLVL
jgi:hypothetical protein